MRPKGNLEIYSESSSFMRRGKVEHVEVFKHYSTWTICAHLCTFSFQFLDYKPRTNKNYLQKQKIVGGACSFAHGYSDPKQLLRNFVIFNTTWSIA